MADQYKDSFMKMASSAISASKTGWTRARQFTEEQIGSSERTEYGAQFENSLVQAENTKSLTDKLLKNFEAVLQPNPAVRLEEFVYGRLEKPKPLRPTNTFYLGQVMQDGSQDMGPGTAYGSTLLKVGTCMKKMGNAEKDFKEKSMEGVLQPLQSSLNNELKTISKEKRTLDVKRLDLDACKNKAKKSATADKMRTAEMELRQAESEYDRQYNMTQVLLDGVSTSHNNHLDSLRSFVDSLGQYHTQCLQYVTELQAELGGPPFAAGGAVGSRPSAPPPAVNGAHGGEATAVARKKARVLADYDGSDASELSLLANEVISVYESAELNEGWIMAERGTQKGKVPVIYLELL